MRRLGHTDAKCLTGISESTNMQLEGGDKANIYLDKLIKMVEAYGYTIECVFLNYKSLPSVDDWRELRDKTKELGDMAHIKDYPLPGTPAGKELDEAWWKWGKAQEAKFFERVRKA